MSVVSMLLGLIPAKREAKNMYKFPSGLPQHYPLLFQNSLCIYIFSIWSFCCVESRVVAAKKAGQKNYCCLCSFSIFQNSFSNLFKKFSEKIVYVQRELGDGNLISHKFIIQWYFNFRLVFHVFCVIYSNYAFEYYFCCMKNTATVSYHGEI